MTELASLPAGVLEGLIAADTALHNGDAAPRKRLWSHTEAIALFGAALTQTGWAKIGQTFDWLASRFSNCTSFQYEVLQAETSGDLAYIVGIERTTASVGGAPPAPYALRVTTVLRREEGQWKVVHRHADPYGTGSSAQVSRI